MSVLYSDDPESKNNENRDKNLRRKGYIQRHAYLSETCRESTTGESASE